MNTILIALFITDILLTIRSFYIDDKKTKLIVEINKELIRLKDDKEVIR